MKGKNLHWKKYWNNTKKTWSVIFKIILLVIGFVSLFDLMPQAYGIVDDVLTAYVLMIFWLELDITRLMFGTRNKFLDKVTIGTFYVLIVNTFVQWVKVIDITDPVIINTYGFLSRNLPNMLSSAVKNAFLFVHNPANSQLFSLLSSYIGFGILGLIILYMTFFVKFKDRSLIYSISSIFIKNREFWDKINDLKERIKDAPVRIILVTITVLIIYQYVFLLITQWFLITLGKTLFIFAILYALKDLKSKKSKTVNKAGKFDDMFLKWVTDHLTDKSKVYLAFGLLLILHYMSDLSTFFIPFFTGVEVSGYFVSLMGSQAYTPLFSLITTDLIYGIVETWWVYVFSTIGILTLILLPMILLFFTLMKVNLKRILDNKRIQVVLNIFLVGIVVFFMGPWVKQLVIKSAGIQGVNFVTELVSSASYFSIYSLFIISFVLLAALTLLIVILRKNVFSKYLFIISYLISLSYLGQYVWNYFQSSIVYHTDIIMYSGNMFLSIVFSILLFVEFLFYIGGFILLCYKFSLYIIRNIIKEIITDANIIIWTFLFLATPILIMYNISIATLTWASISILVLFVFTFAMSRYLKGKEYRDDYLLGLGIIIITYQVGLVIMTILSKGYALQEQILNFMQPIIIFILAFFVLLFFGVRVKVTNLNFKKVIFTIISGIVFGALFYAINEPTLSLPSKTIIIVSIFTLFVALAEEMLFRGILFRLAQKAFSYNKALFLQAFVFASVHFFSVKQLFQHYTINKHFLISSAPWMMVIYFVSLTAFGIMAGLFTRGKLDKQSRIIYPMIMHWIVNIIVYLL